MIRSEGLGLGPTDREEERDVYTAALIALQLACIATLQLVLQHLDQQVRPAQPVLNSPVLTHALTSFTVGAAV